MDTARIAAWLMNEKELQDSSLRTAQPSFLRRPPQPQNVVTSAGYPDRDWTNPNRFSDPLHRTSRLSSCGLTLPGRPNKAYTWHLDSQLPCTRTTAKPRTNLYGREQSRARAGGEDGEDGGLSRSRTDWGEHELSLFATAVSKPDAREGKEMRMKGRGHLSHTWERVGQHQEKQYRERAADLGSRTLAPGSAVSLPGRLSPRVFSQPGGGRSLTPTESLRGQIGGSAYVPSHTSRQRDSPCHSQRVNASPHATVNRLSPGVFHRLHSPASRHSPTPHLSSGRSPYSSTHSTSPNSPYLSKQTGNSLIPSTQSSPFSSQASSNGDVSCGSETDDDFFYVSCHELARGLADLSVSSSPSLLQGARHDERTAPLTSPRNGDYAEEEFDFGGFSDDALSDDVFLDNPQPADMAPTELLAPGSTSDLSPQSKETNRALVKENNEGSEIGAGAIEPHPAVESLRRNSIQSKMRQTWRNRRHKGSAGHRASSSNRGSQDTSTRSSSGRSSSTDQPASQNSSSPLLQPSAEEKSTTKDPEEKPCYYYVISPTDDVDMPDVIAVRKSSVELIRWQNSLRRRRRRQAKRHDLGRVTKREPKLSATV